MTFSSPTGVVLASTSPSRRALLAGAGVTFDAVGPGVDEDAVKVGLLAEGASPKAVAETLAEMKAVKVSRKVPGLVIGADQTLELDGALMDKAPDMAAAREHLIAMRGKRHSLHAAVVIARDGQPIWREIKSAHLTVRDFSDDFLDAYLAREGEDLLWSVGCYKLEGEGVQLFSAIDGDYFTILGLPMLGLLDLLRRHGALTR